MHICSWMWLRYMLSIRVMLIRIPKGAIGNMLSMGGAPTCISIKGNTYMLHMGYVYMLFTRVYLCICHWCYAYMRLNGVTLMRYLTGLFLCVFLMGLRRYVISLGYSNMVFSGDLIYMLLKEVLRVCIPIKGYAYIPYTYNNIKKNNTPPQHTPNTHGILPSIFWECAKSNWNTCKYNPIK